MPYVLRYKKIVAKADDYTIQISYADNVAIHADFSDIVEKGIMTILQNPFG